MSNGEIQGRMLYANAFNLWLDYGKPPPFNVDIPASDMRLVSGLPFSLYLIDGDEGSQEGTVTAVVAGNPKTLVIHPDGPLVRMHSACIFSEFGDNPDFNAWIKEGVKYDLEEKRRFTPKPSDECDCRAQRLASQKEIAYEGGVYLDLVEQEGRGWGLDIKREIYRLQRKEGLDTAQACERLGIAFDNRRYRHCAEFLLNELGLKRIRLMTNNPRKVADMEDIAVTRVPLLVGVTEENVEYLRTKRDKAGHILPADLRPE